MKRLQGRVAIVTGAASGIGAATAVRLAEEGATVVLTDIQDDRGADLAASVDGLYLHQDVSDETRWDEVIAAVQDRYGRLDVLVNNAGIFAAASIEETTLSLWNRVIGVNLTGVMLGCRAAIRAMKENPGGPRGSIVNVSSITGYIGLASGLAYTTSKGGVRLLTKSVAVHCARQYKDIRCNSLHPGTIDTPLNQAAFEASQNPDAMRAFFNSIQPVGRMAGAEEMAACIAFLASDDASFVTGAELLADGGWLAAGGPL